MTPYEIPTVESIANAILSEYEANTGETVPLLKKAVIKILAYAFAGVVVLLWNFGAWQYLQIFVQTSELEALKRWGSLVGIEYQIGDKAVLTADITGATAATITTEVSYLSETSGQVYQVQSPETVVGGNATVTIICLSSGSIGNLTNGEVIKITNPFTGVPDTAIIASTVNVGSEDEDIELYRERVLARYQNPPQGGSAADYLQWGIEVPEIIDIFPYVFTPGIVRIYPVQQGSGTDRIPTGSVSPNPFPNYVAGLEQPLTTSGVIGEVALSINSSGNGVQDRRPATAAVEILPPIQADFTIVIIGLSPTPSTDLKNAIKDAIIAYMDTKRPEIPSLGYDITGATVFQTEISTVVQNLLISQSGGSFTSLTLEFASSIESSVILSQGEIAILDSLSINGSPV